MIKHVHVFLLFSVILLNIGFSQSKSIDVTKISIVRDEWGVAHIYGDTDAETAYGFAWAAAEDNFQMLQQAYLSVLSVKGITSNQKMRETLVPLHEEGFDKFKEKVKMNAFLGFTYQLLEIDKLVDEKYEKDISPAYKACIEAYCKGLNAYAAKYPEKVLNKKIFPITPKVVIGYYILASSVNCTIDRSVKMLLDKKEKIPLDEKSTNMTGSNAFAFRKEKTTDNKTYLSINPHLPMNGIMALYEVHVVSKEGLNFYGAAMPGTIFPVLGANENLGWGHTTNYFDKIDVFKLVVDNSGTHYKFDGKWLPLEKKKLKLTLWEKNFKLYIPKTVYKTHFGYAIKKKGGYYVIRTVANQQVTAAEQWYRMIKSKNLSEFTEALKMQGHGSQSITYADRENNIFFINNGAIPDRNPNYRWDSIVRGDISATIWDKVLPITANPQSLNPKAGYVFNTNHTPFTCTASDCCPNIKDYPHNIANFDVFENNRSIRFKELYKPNELISMEGLKAIKFDKKFSPNCLFMEYVNQIRKIDDKKYPQYAEILNIIRNWDGNTDGESIGVSAVTLIFDSYFGEHGYNLGIFHKRTNIPEEEYLKGLKHATKYLKKHYGSLNVKYKDLFKHIRGNKSISLFGYADIMAQMAGTVNSKGVYEANIGEDFIMFVSYSDKETYPTLETLKAYGASNDPNSPHYNDQMELFATQKPKKVSIDKEYIFKHAKKIYSPTGDK
ncbi:MAG: penicillin acylase family protein [Bacteroidales bacterium]